MKGPALVQHKFRDALKSKGSKSLLAPLGELRRHVLVKEGRVEFTPPPELDEAMAGVLAQSVQGLNALVAKGLVKVNADGSVQVLK